MHLLETRIHAFQIAENLAIKKIRQSLPEEPYYFSSYELFYIYKEGYIYILNYGIIVFTNIEESERIKFLDLIRPFSENPIPDFYREDFIIYVKPDEKVSFAYNSIVIPELNPGVARIIMLHVAQSSALDFYMEKAQEVFEETAKLATQLETQGRLKTSRKKILKFVGKTMNTRNRIIDDLYVIDSPASVWENEILGTINEGLSNTFDIKTRFRELEYILKNIEGNLSIFTELVESEVSRKLELIIIGLILFEVLHLFI
jgi:required for meiotic nuclear division protein 1